MTALDSTSDEPVQGRAEAAPVEAAPVGSLAGVPAALGLPCFIAGSVALGEVLVGVVPATAVGASLPIILASTSVGLYLATIWCFIVGQSAVGSVFGIFGGFWLSYAVLVLGLTHNWFGITAAATTATQKLFLIAWLVVIIMLTLATLRLPLAFTLLFVLVDVALLLVLLGTTQASTGLLKTGGYFVFAFAAVGVYLFFDTAAQITGGKAFALGRPVLKG